MLSVSLSNKLREFVIEGDIEDLKELHKSITNIIKREKPENAIEREVRKNILLFLDKMKAVYSSNSKDENKLHVSFSYHIIETLAVLMLVRYIIALEDELYDKDAMYFNYFYSLVVNSLAKVLKKDEFEELKELIEEDPILDARNYDEYLIDEAVDDLNHMNKAEIKENLFSILENVLYVDYDFDGDDFDYFSPFAEDLVPLDDEGEEIREELIDLLEDKNDYDTEETVDILLKALDYALDYAEENDIKDEYELNFAYLYPESYTSLMVFLCTVVSRTSDVDYINRVLKHIDKSEKQLDAPDLSNMIYNCTKATLLFQKGEVDKGEKMFNDLIKKDNNGFYYAALIDSLHKIGDDEKARYYIKKAMEDKDKMNDPLFIEVLEDIMENEDIIDTRNLDHKIH